MANEERNTEELWDRIERYLRDEMSSEERSGFESEIATDKSLKQEVELHRMVHDTLGDPAETRFRETLADVIDKKTTEKPQPAKVRKLIPDWRLISVAATVLIALGVFTWFNPMSTSDQFADNFDAYPMVLTQRSQADTAQMDVLITEAVRYYESQEYPEAAASFGRLAQLDPGAVTFPFYQAISHIASGDLDQAIPLLEDVLTRPDHLLIEQTRWYLGLALWGNGDEERSRQVLGEIQPGQFKYNEARAMIDQ